MVEVRLCGADGFCLRRGFDRGMTVKIYTKTGDQGMTGLLGKGRVPKDDVRIEAYGTVDELNAVLGLVRAQGLDSAADALAAQLQSELFVVGSALADPSPSGPFHHAITAEHVAATRDPDRRTRNRVEAADAVHSARRYSRGRAHSSGADRLPPRRAADRQAIASAGRGRFRLPGHLPESPERPLVRLGPRGQPPRRGRRYAVDGYVNGRNRSNLDDFGRIHIVETFIAGLHSDRLQVKVL